MKSSNLFFIFLVFILEFKFILSIECQNTSVIRVNFFPENADNIYQNENKKILITFFSDCPPVGEYIFQFNSNGNQIFELSERTFLLTSEDIRLSKNYSFNIEAKSIGRLSIEWTLNYVNNDRIRAKGNYFSSVIHKDNGIRTIFTIFTTVLTILMIINYINMGCQLNLDVIKKVLKKPVSPAIGFMSQFLFMPLVRMI
jgi:sodium/bile acid cotransporter 3/5